MEVALLKSALLTFDHVLASSPTAFTRAHVLRILRDEILAVTRGVNPLGIVGRTSWGIDYEAVDTVRTFVGNYRPQPQSQFEHVLLISIQESGSADLFFLVAGVDLYRFRICDQWPGPAFHILCGAGLLLGEAPYGPVYLSQGLKFGAPTQLRSVFPQSATHDDVLVVTRSIGERRRNAIRSGHALVEMRADDFVHEQMIELETLGATTLEATIIRRLQYMYDGILLSPAQQGTFSELVANGLRAFRSETRNARPSALAPELWLSPYRELFSRVCQGFGLPGRIFEIESGETPSGE